MKGVIKGAVDVKAAMSAIANTTVMSIRLLEG
jgi:hypothetical protein